MRLTGGQVWLTWPSGGKGVSVPAAPGLRQPGRLFARLIHQSTSHLRTQSQALGLKTRSVASIIIVLNHGPIVSNAMVQLRPRDGRGRVNAARGLATRVGRDDVINNVGEPREFVSEEEHFRFRDRSRPPTRAAGGCSRNRSSEERSNGSARCGHARELGEKRRRTSAWSSWSREANSTGRSPLIADLARICARNAERAKRKARVGAASDAANTAPRTGRRQTRRPVSGSKSRSRTPAARTRAPAGRESKTPGREHENGGQRWRRAGIAGAVQDRRRGRPRRPLHVLGPRYPGSGPRRPCAPERTGYEYDVKRRAFYLETSRRAASARAASRVRERPAR